MRGWLASLLLVAGIVACGPRAPTVDDPAGSLAFAALGDAPYYWYEQGRYRRVLGELATADIELVIHVGDLFWRPCSDAMYRQRRAELDGLPHPVVYTPGDNEWTDCWRRRPGGFDPLERLRSLRGVFFDAPRTSLGGQSIALESQADMPPHNEFVENARWRQGDVVFATIHLVGSDNAGEPFPGRGAANDAEARDRTAAAVAWLGATFAAAEDARVVVLAVHANLFMERPAGHPDRRPFEPFLDALEREVERFGGPVALIHGDYHDFIVDRPLVDRRTGRRLENLTRIQVPGSPDVGWARVVVLPDGPEPLRVEPFVASRIEIW